MKYIKRNSLVKRGRERNHFAPTQKLHISKQIFDYSQQVEYFNSSKSKKNEYFPLFNIKEDSLLIDGMEDAAEFETHGATTTNKPNTN